MTNDSDVKIAAYYRLNPTQYTFVTSLSIRQGIGLNGVMEQSVIIVLQKSYDDATPSLRLEFTGVRRLEIQQPELSQISLAHVEISSGETLPQVREKYLVRDAEQERIVWFECRDFEAVVQ